MIDWLFKPLAGLFARRPEWRDAFGRLLLRMGKRFYIALAVVFALAGAWDQFVYPFSSKLSNASFDWLMRHRPIAYPADPNIVVFDIDEASLAALSTELGRWPWPRQILAQVAEKLERGGAQAVVFDILFADPDVSNPDSEATFDRYVKASRNSFFPALRLNPSNDNQSQITLSMLNFASPDPTVSADHIDPRRTIALLPPYFQSIYDSTRTGIHNIYPDDDNVVRGYPNYESIAGYRIPSLPYRMAEALRWPKPARPRSLINWPRSAAGYETISFVDAYRAAVANNAKFYTRFARKIVLIGSTAPSLNDIKATPVDRVHPGVYVLATAIDNTKSGRFLASLSPALIWVLEILMLAGSAHLFANTNQALTMTKYFFIVPTVLLGISLLSISVSDVLVDLSVPTAIVLGYFAAAKFHDTHSRDFISGAGIFTPTKEEIETQQLQVASLPVSMGRDQVLAVLQQPGATIKLWEPPKLGLGELWNDQGWVLWRRIEFQQGKSVELPATTAASQVQLHWVNVRTSASDLSMPLAQRIADALATMPAMNHADMERGQ